jgi:hypothetical protein
MIRKITLAALAAVLALPAYAAPASKTSTKPFDRDSPDGSSQSPTMVAKWASDCESGLELS